MPTVNYTYLPQFAPGTYFPTFDPTGLLPANQVTGEVHTITAVNGRDFHFIVPLFAPFFAYPGAVELTYTPAVGPSRLLVEGVDFQYAFEFIGASRGCSKPVYGGISLLNGDLAGRIGLKYRTIGGNWCLSLPEITEILANATRNPRIIAWEQVTNYPTLFPVIDHEWYLPDLVGMSAVVEQLGDVAEAISNRPTPILPIEQVEHLNNFNNPHQVTKAQVGLGLANNYATATEAETVTGTATNLHVTPAGVKAATDATATDLLLELQAHITDKANPHEVTKEQVGLSRVDNYATATIAEAQAHTATDKFMTPATTWAEILTAFAAGNLDIVANKGTFASTLQSSGQVRAANGSGANANHGFSFTSEPTFDTGMFSPADGYLDLYSNGVLQLRMRDADAAVQVFKKVQGATIGMAMVQGDGTNNGSFTARGTGGGDGNLAGMAFHHDNYGIKMGVRNDGYFGLGGWSRPGWSWYSDPSGNTVAAGNVTAYSDPELKENVEPIQNAMKSLRKIDGVYFSWKHNIPHIEVKAGSVDLGILADQVEAQFPQMVYRSISLHGKWYRTVAYEKFVPVLIQGLREVDSRVLAIEELTEKLAAKDRTIEELVEAVQKLDQRIRSLEARNARF